MLLTIAERRVKALDEVLEELAALDRLRRLVAGLRSEEMVDSTDRVEGFLDLAERRLASREVALSAEGLEQRFEKLKMFGDDDDHGFRPPMGIIRRRPKDQKDAVPWKSSLFQTICWCY